MEGVRGRPLPWLTPYAGAMPPSVLIIGAGMSGLAAARRLHASGAVVTLIDKSRAVGGRMATRRFGGGAGDQGAQHISVRTEAFASEMARLVDDGIATEWLRSQSITRPERGVESRYAGVGGMRRIPERLAEGLDVITTTRIGRLSFEGEHVTAVDVDGGDVATAEAVIVTPPLPQALDLLEASGLDRPVDLDGVGYHASLTVLAILDAPSGIPGGHLAPDGSIVGWIADNEHKGVSEVPSITVQSTAAFAARHIDGDRDAWATSLLEAARPYHAGTPVATHAHAWRYAEPTSTFDEGSRRIDAPVPLVLAGEVFAGARVEGAWTSGLAAADLISGNG